MMQFGLALVFPSKAAKATTLFPEKAGKVAALFGCTLFLGGSSASAIMSELPEDSLLPLAIVLMGLLMIMSIFHFMQPSIDTDTKRV